MKEQIGYKCNYCTRMSSSKGAMTLHERACKHNPNNRSLCDNCVWMKPTTPIENIEDIDVTFEHKYYKEQIEATYCVEPRTCLFFDKMYFKYNGELEKALIERGYTKQPTENQTCKFFISAMLGNEIRRWKYKLSRADFLLSDKLTEYITPQMVIDYYKEQNMPEQAELWVKYQKGLELKTR